MKRWILALIMLPVLVASCCPKHRKKPAMRYDRPLPPGEYALRKITDPSEIPDFSMACNDLTNLRKAVAHSLSYLHKPSSKTFYPSGQITHSQALESVQAFADMLDSGLSGRQLNDEILISFDVYTSVGCDDRGTVLFTGYYTPIFEGSLERTAQFTYPLYEQPDDLVKGPDGEILGRRDPGGGIGTYPDRASIEDSGMLEGKELVYLGDPFEAYIAHVQGSAKVRLPDGNITTVGYAANNGHEYKSVAQELVRDGKIDADQISLATMIAYFKKYKDQVSKYVRRNPRFVFFRKEGGPPVGCLNEPVTPVRSIATDKSIFPRASLSFISTTLPRAVGGSAIKQAYTGFALDQDAGGAIRAPGRCDVYMGEGEMAGKLAGQTYQEGRLYYLFLKSDEIVLE
ncbi:MAG TPA: murein transglycosylase [Phycisphaerales bacterium]|nr:murein transglycosylase [Phycisphaerales bacterium]